jgi:tetratricopeptide (TPR) repeat protein
LVSNSTKRVSVLFIILAVSLCADGQKRIQCPDGEHFEIDIKQISIQYNATSFQGTLNGLKNLGLRVKVDPKKLQEVAEATQQWDVFLKALVAGYNNCVVSKQKYVEELNHIYPRLKEDAASLEEIRKAISANHKADTRQFQILLDRFYANLKRFAQISGTKIILKRLDAISGQIGSLSEQVARGQLQQRADTERIMAMFADEERRKAVVALSTPGEVDGQLIEVKRRIFASANEAELAYKKGFDLFQQRRLKEAIVEFKSAVETVPLPEFYLALGRTYDELNDYGQAEIILRKGLAVAEERGDAIESRLATQLAVTLIKEGKLDESLIYVQQGLAIDSSDVGKALQEQEDLDGAFNYTERALNILRRLFGIDHPSTRRVARNLEQIKRLQEKQ